MNRLLIALSAALFLSLGASLPHVASAQTSPPWVGPRLIIDNPAERPVVIASARVETRITGSFAVTTLELALHNPNRRVLEGSVEFPLRDGQQVIGMASEVNGKLREAVAVEKAKGREVFDEVVRTRIDPALLEKTAGNNYKLRVYPINPNGETRLAIRILENLQETGQGQLFRLPLGFASDLGKLALTIKVDDPGAAPQLSSQGLGRLELKPAGRFYEVAVERGRIDKEAEVAVLIPDVPASRIYLGEHDEQRSFYAELPIETLAVARPRPKRLAILWDASMSGANRKRDDELTLLRRYLAALGDVEVTLHLLRDRIEPPRHFAIQKGDSTALAEAIRRVVYDGATNLYALPGDLAADAALLFSDGLHTFGAERPALPAIPVSVISSALQADTQRLRHIARQTGGSFVDLGEGFTEAGLTALLHEAPGIAGIDGEGIEQMVSQPVALGDRRLVIAGLLVGAQPRLTLRLRGTREATLRIEPDGFRTAAPSPQVPRRWAQLRIAELEAERDLHRGEILRLGRMHGMVSSETSLIVLDRVEDYARHGIVPPSELRADYYALISRQQAQQRAEQAGATEALLAAWERRRAWWKQDFPKDQPKPVEPPPEVRAAAAPARQTEASARTAANEHRQRAERSPGPGDEALLALMARAAAPPPPPDSAAPDDAKGTPRIGVTLKKWRGDAPYIARLSAASPDRLYAVYLDQRPDNANSSAFYLDAADLLFEHGQAELALRVLSNLAEMQIENRDLLRVLAARLTQAGQAALAVPLLRRVLEIAPDEPHSLRDLALALDAAGQPAEALRMYGRLLRKRWDDRFGDIAEIALAEANALLSSRSPGRPKNDLAPSGGGSGAVSEPGAQFSRHPEQGCGEIDPRLIDNLPVALRVVLTWDTDNTDIDLAVVDPNGEKVSYDNKLSYQGGRISRDVTRSYGPEEFILKLPKPGKYRIHANFFGHGQQVLSSATTVQAEITTGFGGPAPRVQAALLRLRERKEDALVAEVEVK